VHVLLRRVDDEFLDPLELRPTPLGVPGLLQALRAGEVVVANAPGAGVLESPGLHAFWPGVAERLLGESCCCPPPPAGGAGRIQRVGGAPANAWDYVVACPPFPGTVTQSFEPVRGGG
jgi:uncharacterized circularly permuted ATP-grasp superfamily protein